MTQRGRHATRPGIAGAPQLLRPRRSRSAPCLPRRRTQSIELEQPRYGGLAEVLRPGLRIGSTYVACAGAGKPPWQQAPFDHGRADRPIFSLAEITRSHLRDGGCFVRSSGSAIARPPSQSCFLSQGVDSDRHASGTLSLCDVVRPGVRSGTFLSSAGDALSSPSRDSFLSPSSSERGSECGPGRWGGGFVDLRHRLRPGVQTGTTMLSSGDALSSSRRDSFLASCEPDSSQVHHLQDVTRPALRQGSTFLQSSGCAREQPRRRPASAGAVTAAAAAAAAAPKPWRQSPKQLCQELACKDSSPESPDTTHVRCLRFQSCGSPSSS